MRDLRIYPKTRVLYAETNRASIKKKKIIILNHANRKNKRLTKQIAGNNLLAQRNDQIPDYYLEALE